MNYETAESELLAEFPHLREEDGFKDAAGLPHVVFGAYFSTWLRGLLNSGARSPSDELEIGKAFRFIERMLESGDEGLENVVAVSILNYLVHYCGLARVAPWCGPLSASWLDRLPPP